MLHPTQIAFYGLGLNSSIILQAIGFGTPPVKGVLGKYETLHNVCVGNIILAIAGLIPGYYAALLVIDRWGRKPIQFMGFGLLTILFAIMGKRHEISRPACGIVIEAVLRFRLPETYGNGPEDKSFRLLVLSRQLLPELWTKHDNVRHPG
jgi:PHS family inorganic phosphate transporter-like MFS transporter